MIGVELLFTATRPAFAFPKKIHTTTVVS